MKVLHLLASGEFSGAEHVAVSIIESLSDDFDFVYASKDGEIHKVLDERKIKHHLVKEVNLKTVKRIIEEEKPDIIHAHDYFASTYAALSGFRGKIISHQHSDITLAKKWNKYMLIFAFALRRINKIIFVSSDIPKNVIYKNRIKGKAEIIPNIVDEERVLKLSKEKNNERYDIVYLGRLSEEKNPLAFIEIVKKISEKRPATSAVMLGDGCLRDQCESEIKNNNLNITMKGFVDNPFPIIKNSICSAMPSKYEGLSLGAVQCLILGKPVFNSGVSGFNDIYSGKNIYLCKDVDEYAEKISEYLENPVKPKVNLKKFTNKKAYFEKIKSLYVI